MQGSCPAVAALPQSQIPGLSNQGKNDTAGDVDRPRPAPRLSHIFSELGDQNDDIATADTQRRSSIRDTDSAYANRGGQRYPLSPESDVPWDNSTRYNAEPSQQRPDYDSRGYRKDNNASAMSGSLYEQSATLQHRSALQ